VDVLLLQRLLYISALTITEHHAEHAQRELLIARLMTLRLRSEDAALEHPASLHRFEVEPMVLIALPLGRRHPLLEIFQPPCDLDLGHNFASDRSAISRQREAIASITFPQRRGSWSACAGRSTRWDGRLELPQVARSAFGAAACRGCSTRCGRTRAP